MGSDEAYQAVLKVLAELSDAWRIHREVVNRAISLLNHEVLSLVDRMDKDDDDRGVRQSQLDSQIKVIIDGQDQIRRWQWIRIGVEVTAILVIAAFLYGASR
jgi:hypothetical protein